MWPFPKHFNRTPNLTSVYLSNHSPLNSGISLHFRYHREYQEIKDIGPTGLRQLNYSAFLCRRLRKIPNWIYPCDFSLPIRRLIVWTCCTSFVWILLLILLLILYGNDAFYWSGLCVVHRWHIYSMHVYIMLRLVCALYILVWYICCCWNSMLMMRFTGKDCV